MKGVTATHDTGPRRRAVMVVSAVVAVGALGAGLLARRGPPVLDTSDAHALWQGGFETPDGAPLSLQPLQGGPLLVNFWATWCPPCVAELPMLETFYQAHAAAGWKVLGIAVDQPSSVRKFLGRNPVSFPVAMAGLRGTALSKVLGNVEGGLPFTLVLNRDGGIVQRKMGQLTATDLVAWTAS